MKIKTCCTIFFLILVFLLFSKNYVFAAPKKAKPTITPSPTPVPCTLPGDTDCSNTVDVSDLSLTISAFSGTNVVSDFDKSGKVNGIDLSILLSNFGAP